MELSIIGTFAARPGNRFIDRKLQRTLEICQVVVYFILRHEVILS